MEPDSILKNSYPLYLNLKINKVEASIKVIRFAAIRGRSFIRNPYTNQSATPKEKIVNMLSERSFADLDFHVLKTCGKKAIVVQAPATKPRN
jgi:hypothetical protein